MRIPVRFAPLLFSALLSAIMVCIVSGFVLVSARGLGPDLPMQWLRSCLRTWPVAFPTVFLVAPLVRRVVTRLTATVAGAVLVLALPTATSVVSAQQASEAGGRWEVRVVSGKVFPLGDARARFRDAGVTMAQVSRVPGSVALSASLGWARSRDLTATPAPRLDIFLYDVAAEVRMGAIAFSEQVGFRPFVGLGAGARRYDQRGIADDANDALSAFGAIGGELGIHRLRVRLELRDQVSGGRAHAATERVGGHHELVGLVGFRLAPR